MLYCIAWYCIVLAYDSEKDIQNAVMLQRFLQDPVCHRVKQFSTSDLSNV